MISCATFCLSILPKTPLSLEFFQRGGFIYGALFLFLTSPTSNWETALNPFSDSISLSTLFFVSRDTFASHSINTFILDIECTNPDHLNSLIIPNLTTWVNLVVQRKLKHLHLHLNFLNALYGPDMKFPNSIFSCKTLVVLNLSWFSVNSFSFSSVGFGFPSLKKLHLNCVRFNVNREFLLLLAGCPVLEDLKACRVFISSGAWIYPEFDSLSLSKLIRADITGCYYNFPMKALSNLEFLRIQLSQVFAPYAYPTFHNLTHLVVNNIWDLVLQALHHFPKLQHLDLYQKAQSEWDKVVEERFQERWVEPKSSPQCLSLYLRTCTIRDFTLGHLRLQDEIMLARYILNNARVLQTMTLWSDKEQPQIEMELFSCPRASSTCQLSVYY